MKKTLLSVIVAAVVVGAGAFYGGMKYGQSARPNLSSAQRQQFQANRGTGANFLSGEIIAKDAQSLTLKLPDGGSKIVFTSASTAISKMTDGAIADIEIGKQIMVTGQQNSDGSITAQSIQLR